MMARSSLAICVLVLLQLGSRAHAFYAPGGDVLTLTPQNFEDKLAGRLTLVEFFAPWCGHCKTLKPEWERAAAALKGIVGVAAVDADAHPGLAQQYGIQGFPTIKLFYSDSGNLKPVDYQGGRTANDIVQWATQQAQKVALKRLGIKSGSSAGGGGGGGSGSGGFYGNTPVTTLDDGNFHSLVVDSDELYFVEFYAPWCGHCKSLKPTWIELAGALEGKVRVGAVDCTENQAACGEFGIKGFPTIKFFGANKARPESYERGRDLGSLTAYAMERWARAQPPPEVRELMDHETWEEHCLGHESNAALDLKGVKPKQLCLVAFLPHILDSGAAGRKEQLAMLIKVAALYKERPFAWFWAQGGAQAGLEANLGVGGYGYPALVALNPVKAKFAALRGAFAEAEVAEFMDAVRAGRERVSDMIGEPAKVEARGPWDGEDGQVEGEEEFSLEDLGIGGKEEL